MSAEQKSPEPDNKSSRLARLQRGPFLASWLAHRDTLETGEDYGGEEDIETLDSDWRRFLQSWHRIFSGVKVPVQAKDKTKDKRLGQDATSAKLGSEAIAVVSDKYRGELRVLHDDEASDEDELDDTYESHTLTLPKDLVDEIEKITTEPEQPEIIEPAQPSKPDNLDKPKERITPVMQDTATTQPTQPQAIASILENRRPIDLSYLASGSSRAYLNNLTNDLPKEPTPESPQQHAKLRGERTIAPLPPTEFQKDLPTLIAEEGEPEESYLEAPGDEIAPTELANEYSVDAKEVPEALPSSSPTHVADILSNSPLFNQPAQPPQPEQPIILPPTQPIPRPLTPEFATPVPTNIDGARYRQAIKTGFWGGIFVTFVLAIVYIIK